MKLTRVEAPSMKEALLKIKMTLGDDALIVGTRTLRKGGVLGVGGREYVEVYVSQAPPQGGGSLPRTRMPQVEAPRQGLVNPTSHNEELQPRGTSGTRPVDPQPTVFGQATHPEALEALRGLYPQSKNPYSPPQQKGDAPVLALPKSLGADDPVERLAKYARERGWKLEDFQETKRRALEANPPQKEIDHPFLKDAELLLKELEISPKMIEGLLWELRTIDLPVGVTDPNRLKTLLKSQVVKLLAPNLPQGVQQEPLVQIFLGPTGVGKTTTVAKLAARAKINERKQVGLITLDTFRIAAVDQLQKYARIIGVTLEVVSDPIEFRSAVARLKREGLDRILVDTAGRGQRDELKMRELEEFVKSIPDAEVHLVLSTTTHPRTFTRVAHRFIPLGAQRLILTKLDESEAFGALLEPLVDAGLPVSFITDGQNVPDDIMLSDPERLTDLVFRTRAF